MDKRIEPFKEIADIYEEIRPSYPERLIENKMNIGTRTIATERLVLRKLTIKDAEAIFKNLKSDERITDNMIKAAHKELEETIVWLKENLDQYGDPLFCYWGIELVETRELIGMIDLYNINIEESKCEVGYLLGYNWWNKGYGTEALKAVVAFAFEKVGINEIYASHNIDNPASGRIMEKVGMKKVDEVKAMIRNAKGQSKDCGIYCIKNR